MVFSIWCYCYDFFGIIIVLKITVYSLEIFEEVKVVIEKLIKS